MGPASGERAGTDPARLRGDPREGTLSEDSPSPRVLPVPHAPGRGGVVAQQDSPLPPHTPPHVCTRTQCHFVTLRLGLGLRPRVRTGRQSCCLSRHLSPRSPERSWLHTPAAVPDLTLTFASSPGKRRMACIHPSVPRWPRGHPLTAYKLQGGCGRFIGKRLRGPGGFFPQFACRLGEAGSSTLVREPRPASSQTLPQILLNVLRIHRL